MPGLPENAITNAARAQWSSLHASAGAWIVLAFVAILGGLLAPASANAAPRAFTNSYAQTLHGDIAAIGNANSTCRSAWTTCAPGTLGSHNSNEGYGALIDVDGAAATTTNSSSSTLGLPPGAIVRSARLVWGSAGDGTDGNGENGVRFDTPATAGYAYTAVSAGTACGSIANVTGANTRGFACGADVTALVTAGGSGAYTVGGIEQRVTTGGDLPDHWSGWALYVVFELPTEPLRRLVLADGFQRVQTGAATTITATGFVAPASGAVNASLTYTSGEGDSGIAGDNATFGTRSLDTVAPIDLMDSTISGLNYETSRAPSNLNHYGFDLRNSEINGAIANGASTANFVFNTTQDVYYPFSLGIAIELGEPNLVITKTLTDVNGGVVEPGDTLEYRIVAENQGNDGAAAVTVTDPIPPSTTYVPGSMQVTAGANAGAKTDAAGDDQGTFSAGTGPNGQVTMRLGAGASAASGGILAASGGTTTMTFRVQIAGGVDEGVPLVNTASGSYVGQSSLLSYADPSSVAATPVRRSDMVVAQTLSPGMVNGQAGTVTLTASNIGGAQTYGQPVTVVATIPAGVALDGVSSAPGWTCTPSGLTVTCTRTDPLLGTSAYPDIVLDVTPSQSAGSGTFAAQVSGGNEVRTDNNTDSDAVTFVRSANLRITKAVNVGSASVGDTLTYTLVATNLGPSDTTGVVVSDPLAATLQPLTATRPSGTCFITGQNVTCPAITLASGASTTITITARVLPAAVGTTITNAASLSGSDPDPTPGNNTASVATTIGQAADLHVTKSVAPAAVNLGSNATWTVAVRNDGPGPAAGVSVTDTLPAGVTVQSITASQGTCGTGNPFTCAIGTIASGATATIVVVARPPSSAAGTTITNTATASTTTWDPDASDDSASSPLTVNPAADLQVAKTADKATANVDELITWTVSVENVGPSAALGATITDTAPAGVSIQSVTPQAGVTCSTAGQVISCALGASYPAGATRSVSIVARVNRASAGSPLSNSATTASSTFDQDLSNNLSSVTTSINNASDLRVAKTADRAAANVGDTITWTITATNDGASPATGVQLTDVLPAGVTLTGPAPQASVGPVCPVVANQVVCAIGTLAVGASATLVLTARVEAAAAETPLQNVAQVTGAEFDPDVANNSTSVSSPVPATADLRIAKSVSNASRNVGDALTYTLTAANDGPSTATNVQITDTVPVGFQLTAAPTVTGGSCTVVGRLVTCTVASLASGGARSITLAGQVTAVAAGTTLSNTAAITSDQPDQDPSDNTTPPATTAIAGVADLAITKTVDTASANVGSTLTYTLTVTNAGPQASPSTVVTDALPAGLTRLGAAPSQGSCPAGSPIVCDLGTVPAGGSATITITAAVGLSAAGATVTNSATVDGPLDDFTPGNDTASANSTIAPAADLRIVKTADRATADVGDTIIWTVTATNDGPQSATGVSITDTIPAGVALQTPITGLPGGVTCTPAGQVVSCAVSGALASGDSRIITLRGTVQRAAAETPQENVATVAGSQLDPDPSDNLSRVTTNVGAAADLRVTKVVDVATANVGDTLLWTVAVTNDGPSVATGVQLIDDLPAGTTLLTRSITQGSCTPVPIVNPTQAVCGVGTLASGQTVTATITARVERANAESPVTNVGRATATQLDPDTANNLATATTTIGPSTDLQIAKSVDTATANVGQTLTYTLTATNNGPSTATGVTVTDVLPASLARTGTVTASQGSCNPTGQTLSCTVGSLASGASATYVVRAIVQSAAAATTITNSASVSGGQSDPIPANNTSPPATTTIAGAADVAVVTSVSAATADVGDTLTYTFTARNNGPSTATGFQLVGAIPSGLTVLSSSAPGLACSGSPTVTCTGALASGATATLTVTARVLTAASGQTLTALGTVTATPFDPVAVNNTDDAVTTIGEATDLSLSKSVDRPTANIGDLLTFTLRTDNGGPNTATGVTIADTLPASLAVVGTPTASQGGCAVSGQAITCAIGALGTGGFATVTIVARVQASAASSTVTNVATVDGDQFDPAPLNDTSLPTSTTIGSAADLVVTQTVSDPSINLGDTVDYVVTVSNAGPQTATAVSLLDDLPTGGTVVSITPSQGTCGTGDPFACALGTINAGASATITVRVQIVGAASSTFSNVASATATQFDPNTANNAATVGTSTSPASDLRITKIADRATADVGETITWTVTATNDGPSAATGVTIADTAPSGVTLLPVTDPASSTCSVSGQTVSCARSGSLPVGGTVVLTLRGTVNTAAAGTPLSNSATVSGNEFDPDTANNLSAVTTTINAAADLRVAKTVNTATANVGDTLTWTIVATNDGPSTATGVVATDNLPAGVTLLTRTASQGTCAPSGAQVVCAIGALASGASATIVLTARVERSAAESPVDNVATVTSSVFDPDPADNLSTTSTTVGPAADLRLAKSVDRASANVGDTLTYTLTATNDGPSSATGTAVVDTLPTGLQIAGTPTASQGACTVTGQTVNCSIGTLASGATATVTILATVRAAASATTIGNVASVSGSRLDPDPANDTTTSTTTTVAPAADLIVTHAVDRPSLNLGDTAEFTIQVSNAGPAAATGVTLSDDLPAGTTLVSRTTSQGTCAPSGDPLACALGSIAPGATVTVVVRLRLDTGASATFTSAATASGTEFDPTPANNTASAATSTGPSANLSVAKIADRATADVGETITWSITATNAGPSAATGVIVTDTLPTGVTGVTATGGAGVTCSIAAGTASCAIAGPWASGTSRTIQLTGVVARASAGSPLTNAATIAGAEVDPNLADNVSTVTTTINAAADLRVSKTADRATASVGDTITWTVTATNDGPSAAPAVTITDDLPAGVTLLSATSPLGACSPVGAQVVCGPGALASGQSAAATITARVEVGAAESPVVNAARATSTTFDPDTANNVSSVGTAVGKSIDLTTSAAVDRPTANIGDELLYTFTIANAGPSSATGTSFTHQLPPNVAFVASTTTQGGCASAAGTVTCALGTMASGGNATVTVRVAVLAGAAGTTINARGAVSAIEPDRVPANDQSALVSTTVSAAADLAVTTTVDRSTAAVGDTLTYLVSVTNQGPSTATGVTLTNQIPAGATVISVTPSAGVTCDTADPRVCAVGTLAPNASATLTVVVQTTAANAASLVTDRASATANEFDPVAGNNAAQASSAIGDAADLRIVKTADRATAEVGDTITWTLTATNLGPLGATGVSVTDAIPAGVTITSATSSAGTCTAGSPVSCALGGLANGASATITVVGRVDRAAAGSPLAGQATITGDQLDPVPANNVSATSVTVGPAADLRLTKLIDRPAPSIGDAVEWTIQVVNDGPQPAVNAQLTDVVPAGATITAVTASAGSCTRTGQSVVCDLGTLASGASATATIRATVASGAGGAVLDNAATASSGTRDPDTTNNTATARATAGASADLSVTLTADRASVTVGEAITWNAVVGNGGPQLGTGIVATISLPSGLEGVTATVPGGSCVIAGAVATCTLADLPVGASQTIQLRGTAGRDTAERSLVATAVVTGSRPDPNPADNTASAALVAVPAAVDLVVTKRSDRDNAGPGEQVTITTDVLNRGPSTATKVVLTDTLPDGVTLVSVTPTQGTCTVVGRTVTCDLGDIPNGQTASIALVVTVDVAGVNLQLLNAGVATSGQFDTDGSNNAARITTGGQPAAPSPAATAPLVELTKTVDKASVAAGGEVVFTITATNRGTATATGVRIVDQLPAGLDYVSTKGTGVTCTRNARTITCVASSLPAGKSVALKVTTRVASPGKPIDNVATVVSAGLGDTNAKGQKASARVQASGAPYIVAGIKPLEAYTRPGKTVRIAVKVTNVGQATGSDVQACFTLPSGVVLLRKPAGLTQRGAKFCLTVARLDPNKNKRVVLSARVVGGAGTSRPRITGTATNSRVKTEAYPLVVRGQRAARGNGVTG